MQSELARVCAKKSTKRALWDTGRMAQSDLVAAVRAHKRAEERAKETRAALDKAIREGITSGDWQIVDVAELTGISRETLRKIAYPKAD